MDNNFNQQPAVSQAANPSKLNVTELVALICSSVGTLMAVIGSILTCSCSASKTFDMERLMKLAKDSTDMYSTSLVWLVALFGAIIAVVGVVFAIISLKKNKSSKLAWVSLVVGGFGVMYGILPVLTICGYNCSLNSEFTA